MNLVEACLAGDPLAFEQLFERYKRLVYTTAYLMLGSRDEAEDVLQEVFLQVHRSLASYDPGRAELSTWLHAITVRRCLNQRRRWSRRLLAPWREPAAAGENAWLEQLAQQDAVRRALRRLSPKLRAVLVLRYYHELAYREIAEILELPLGTVQSRLSLALKELQRELERQDAQQPRGLRDGAEKR